MFTTSLGKKYFMNIVQAIEKNDLHATPDQGLDRVQNLMEENGFNALPIVKEDALVGLLKLDALRKAADLKQTIAEFERSPAQIYLFDSQHIFDAIPVMDSHQVNVVPVVGEELTYRGMVTWQGLIHAVNTLLDCETPGSILVLEVGQRDNALSHIAHIVESADAQIMSSFTRQIPDSTQLEITLKINTAQVSPVVAALHRYDYTIKSSYRDDADREDLNARFEHLMNYINM